MQVSALAKTFQILLSEVTRQASVQLGKSVNQRVTSVPRAPTPLTCQNTSIPDPAKLQLHLLHHLIETFSQSLLFCPFVKFSSFSILLSAHQPDLSCPSWPLSSTL